MFLIDQRRHGKGVDESRQMSNLEVGRERRWEQSAAELSQAAALEIASLSRDAFEQLYIASVYP